MRSEVSFEKALASTDSVAILLDTDQNATTGNQNAAGAECLLVASESDNSFGLAHWDGSTWQDASAPTASVNGGGGRAPRTLSLKRRDLPGGPGCHLLVDTSDGAGGPQRPDPAAHPPNVGYHHSAPT